MEVQRFQEVYRLPGKLYIEGSPIVIDTGVLQKESSTGTIIAQVKFLSISSKSIVGCKTAFKAYEINGKELEGVDSFQYLDMLVNEGDYFGAKVPVIMPSKYARKFEVFPIEIVFSDGSVWTNSVTKWEILPDQVPAETVLDDPELLKQYRIEMNMDHVYVPFVTNNLFFCACGAVNKINSPCHSCGKTYDDVRSIFDANSLTEKKNIRLEFEKEEREKQKKKAKRNVCIIAGILAAIIVIMIPTVIIPGINKENAFREASELYNNQQYDEAAKKFGALGQYKNSEELSLSANYMSAYLLYRNGRYEEAAEAFASLGEYSNSKEMYQSSVYLAAQDLLNSGNIDEALPKLDSIGNYLDSAELLQKNANDRANKYIKENDLDKAARCITYLEEYRNSDDKDGCMNRVLADMLYANGIGGSIANGYYGELGRTGSDLEKEKAYQHAKKLSDENQYDQAISIFSSLGNYRDSYTECENNNLYRALRLFNNSFLGNLDKVIYSYNEINAIALRGNEKAKSQIPDVQNRLYERAVSLMITHIESSANRCFQALGDYLDSRDYSNFCKNPASGWKKYINLPGVKESIMWNTDYALWYLVGTWKTKDGQYYIRFEDNNHHYCYHSLPSLDKDGYYKINKGIYSLGKDEKSRTNVFKFSIVDVDTMDVYCYKNGSTYRVYRK